MKSARKPRRRRAKRGLTAAQKAMGMVMFGGLSLWLTWFALSGWSRGLFSLTRGRNVYWAHEPVAFVVDFVLFLVLAAMCAFGCIGLAMAEVTADDASGEPPPGNDAKL